MATADATMAPMDWSTTVSVGSQVAVRAVIMLAAYSEAIIPTIKEMRKKHSLLKGGMSELVRTYTTDPANAPMNTPAGISDIADMRTVTPNPYVATAVPDTGSLIVVLLDRWILPQKNTTTGYKNSSYLLSKYLRWFSLS